MSRKRNRLPVVLSSKEIDSLLKVVVKPRHKLGFAFMCYSGLRVSEMCSLKLSNINLARSFLKIIGKGNKERIVPINSKLLSMIENYIQSNSVKLTQESFLIGGNRRSWHDLIKKYSRLCFQRTDVHCHTLRHSFATNLYEEGVKIEMISQLLGHSRLDTTMIYAHISIEHKSEAVNLLGSSRFGFLRKIERLSKPRNDISFNDSEVLIGRESEVKQIEEYLSNNVSVLLIGSSGSGKSSILKNANLQQFNPVYISEFKKKLTLIKIILCTQSLEESEEAAKNLEKELKKLSIDELLDEIKDIKRLIVIDDISDLTKSDKKIISKLSEKALVISSSSKESDRKIFHTFIEIKPLKRHQIRQVLSDLIFMQDLERKENIISDIIHSSGDNIKEAVYISRQLQLGKSSEDITTAERSSNQVSIAPVLVIFILFFFAYVLKSYASSIVALSYAVMVVFRLVFYRYIFTPTISRSKT
ncbi:MAG: tyrosine-type recombinase/integrase [Spirochaetes bacterium]|nr:tyrosine-type recombinase/integrase [Spirochaetota bacterium]